MIEFLLLVIVIVANAVAGFLGLVIPGLLLLGLVYLIITAAQQQVDLHRRRLKDLAGAWGMQADSSRVSGEIEGVQSSLRRMTVDKKLHRRFEWVLPKPWQRLIAIRKTNPLDQVAMALGSSDISVGHPQLDAVLWITGCEATARAVLGDAEVIELLDHLRKLGRLDIGASTLNLLEPGDLDGGCEGTLRWGAQLVQAMERARRAPWEATAAAFRLELDPDATEMRGFVGGRRVRVAQETVPRHRTIIRVALRPGLPAGTRIARKGPGESARLGDPILDGNIHVNREAATLGDLLGDDDVRGLVMTLVHGYPGSTITDDAIEVVAEGRLMDELDQTVRDAIELAGRLERGVTPDFVHRTSARVTQDT